MVVHPEICPPIGPRQVATAGPPRLGDGFGIVSALWTALPEAPAASFVGGIFTEPGCAGNRYDRLVAVVTVLLAGTRQVGVAAFMETIPAKTKTRNFIP